MNKFEFTEWTTKYINDLPDSAFAYISIGGKKDSTGRTEPRSLRHLPYKDAGGNIDIAHVRNALARLSNTNIPDNVKAGIQAKLEQHLQANKASTHYMGVFPFEFEAPAQATLPTTVHLIPTGQWEHDVYGTIKITQADIQQFADNFNAKIRNGVSITAGHEGEQEKPAVGWITKVEARETGLWGTVEWNNTGKALLADRAYKFFSPEYYTEYEDPQSHQIFKNVIVGGALTKSPYFKELEAVVFSEPEIKSQINNDKINMDITTITAKDKATLTPEDKTFLRENVAQLSEEQKTQYAEELKTEATAEEVQKAAEAAAKVVADAAAAAEVKKAADAAEAAAAAAKVEGSEKHVQISASELQLLRAKADKGSQAFAELQERNISDAVTGLTFSETNKGGRFVPKSSAALKAFIETLNSEQRKTFSVLVSEIPASNIFSEIGASAAAEASANTEVETAIKAKMNEDKSLLYSSALKMVMSENESLETRYDSELKTARAAV